jgi:nitronate monooxygenase
MWHHKKKINFGEELDAAQAEAKAWKTIWSAGHGVTSITDVVPVETLVQRLKTEMKAAIEEQQQWLHDLSL